jgi:predicted acetyltransferase
MQGGAAVAQQHRSASSLDLRAVSAAEFHEALNTLGSVGGISVDGAETQYLRDVAEFERTFAVFDGARVVATAAAQSVELTVPGGIDVPMAALLWARVKASHRRMGLMTRLLEARVDQARERGEVVAGMWVADSAMHSRGKLGFGWATSAAHLEIDRPYAVMNSPLDTRGHVDMGEPREVITACTQIYERARTARPGMLSRSPARWNGWSWRNPEHWLDAFWTAETGPLMVALWDGDGYLMYRMKRAWESGGAEYVVLIAELVTTTVTAYRGLWQWCFALDLATKFVAAQRPIDEPLKHLIAAPRRLATNVTDGLWIYLVDVRAALEQRAYACDGRVVMTIHDPLLHNDGTYELMVEDGKATCRPTTRSADVQMPMATLAACYLGGASLRTLAMFDKADELRPHGVRTLDSMLRTDEAPWCPWVF